MKILITGGSGYIGSILSSFLLEQKYEVTVLDNLLYSQMPNPNLFLNNKYNMHKVDIRNQSLFLEKIASHDIIIPLAAIVGAPACDKDYDLATEINFNQIKFLVDNLSSNQKVILPTTNSGYGIGESGKFCDEESPLNPISHYAKTKTEAEKYLIEKGNGISLRLATVFGPSHRMRLDLLVNDFVYKALTDGYLVLFESHFKRNYIHIIDVCSAILHMISNYERLNNNIYNVGLSDANLSKYELCVEIKKHIQNFLFIESKIREDQDKRDYIVSNLKIEKTGWKPKYTLDDGIISLIKLYKSIKLHNLKNV